MTDITIRNIRISYDESDERVRSFIDYLKNEKRKEELKAYYKEAQHSEDNRIYLNDKLGNEFTLESIGEHLCTL